MPAQDWKLQLSADVAQAAKGELDKHGDSCVHQLMSEIAAAGGSARVHLPLCVLAATSNQNTGARDPQQVLPEQSIAGLLQVT